MFRHEMSTFLRAVLDAVAERPRGVSVDQAGTPDPQELRQLARAVRATIDDVDHALMGLRAAHCLIENVLEFEGALPLVWWTVHPQCARTPEGSGQA